MPDQATSTGRMAAGVVKWFSAEKGYGFIGVETGEHAGRDFFVHHSAIDAPPGRVLSEGQSVEFDIVHGRKGPQAAHVVVVGDAPAAPSLKPEAFADALKHLKAAQSIIEREARKLASQPAPEEAVP